MAREPLHATGRVGASSEPSGLRVADTPQGFTSLQYKFAEATMRALKRNKNAGPFSTPVDPIVLGIPHYATIITHPMDFSTIERKLFATTPGALPHPDEGAAGAARYGSVEAWVSDVRLVFQNSYTFNGKEHPVSKMAALLEASFEKQLKKMPSSTDTSPLVDIPGRSASLISGPPSATTDESRAPSAAATPALQNNVPLPVSSSSDILGEQMKFCRKVLDHLHKPEHQEVALFFYRPVTEEELPGYHKVIKNPMSLAVMRTKLDAGEYPDPAAFKSDFELIVKNACTFNPPGSVAQHCAKSLNTIFEKKWKALPKATPPSGLTTAVKQPPKPVRTSSTEVSKPSATASKAPAPAPPPESNASRRASAAPPPPPPKLPALPTPPPPIALPQSNIASSSLMPSPLPMSPVTPVMPTNPSTTASAPPSNLKKRKSELIATAADDEEEDVRLPLPDQLRLARVIHKLKGHELERAIYMIQDGLADTPCSKNSNGDSIYEIASLPPALVRELYNSFVRPNERSSKRQRRVTAESMMEISDSD